MSERITVSNDTWERLNKLTDRECRTFDSVVTKLLDIVEIVEDMEANVGDNDE